MTDSKKNTVDSENYRKLFDSMDKGFCIVEVLFDDDEKPVDYRFLKVNSSFEAQTGLQNVEGKRMRELVPEHEDYWFEAYGKVALTGEPARFEYYAEMLGKRWFEVDANSFGPVKNRQVALIFSDISKRKDNERSSALLGAIVNDSDDAIISKNLDGIIMSWNASAERIFGYTEQEVIGKPITILIPEELLEEEEIILKRMRRGQRIDHFETVRQRKDGTKFNISLTISPIKDSTGKIIGASKIARNITGKKEAEKKFIALKSKLDEDLSTMTHLHELSLRLTSTIDFQDTLEEILNSIVELQNADFGSLQLYNDEANVLELSVQKGFGPDFEKTFKKVEGVKTACGRALDEGHRIIIKNINNDSRFEALREEALKFGYQSVQSTPLFDHAGDPIGVISTHFKKPHSPTEKELRITDLYSRQATDMIDIKLSEERLRASEKKLQSLNETLEERVERRTTSLLAYQNQLRSLANQLSKVEEQERHRLASDLHDNLGQMLAVIKMNVGLLRKDDEEEIEGISAMLDEAITYTRELMSDLKPPPSLDDEDLKGAVEWVAKKMKKHDLDVSVEDDNRSKPVSEEVRFTLLRSVREMLFNVVKHADANHAEVRLLRTDDHVQVTVEDKGSGFDVDKSRSSDSLEGGFGLFNISERIDFLGGKFELESEPGKGTKVKVSLPVLKKDEEMAEEGMQSIAPAASSEKIPHSRKIKVLLVDDHQIMREGLQRIINEEADLTVIGEASNGREAIEMTRETHPDVIVMDVNMPEMNGIQATQQVKQEFPDVQIIALSFHDNKYIARKMREVGASAYLNKSDAFKTLCATIRSEAVGVAN